MWTWLSLTLFAAIHIRRWSGRCFASGRMEDDLMEMGAVYKKVFGIFRPRRMKMFYDTFQPSGRTRLLDIGGTPYIWMDSSKFGPRFPITLVNLRAQDEVADDRFTAVGGDATQLPFEDASFEIAFSNSVIEHMTTWEQQQRFALEARRVARRLWIQTPARSFPLEPHLFAIYFQFWPRLLQRRMARHFTLWGLLTKPTEAQVEEMISDIRLLTYKEVRQLFPDCRILKERVFGLTKSYVAVR